MINYEQAYQAATHRPLPSNYRELNRLFDAIASGELLPPRSQQAVNAGLVAHALSDREVDPSHYHYYHWVVDRMLNANHGNELSAQLIGMAFVSANIFDTTLPQPLTINPWQAPAMSEWPLASRQAVIIENNGVFIWLHHLHPTWPLIAQGGNDFQPAYLTLLQGMVKQGLRVTYLGDLDATGIRIADTLRRALPPTTDFLALQTPQRVVTWLSLKGKVDTLRTAAEHVVDPKLQQEMNAIVTQGVFVEQEQLITEYETLIATWLQ